jgi:hypothetical protein
MYPGHFPLENLREYPVIFMLEIKKSWVNGMEEFLAQLPRNPAEPCAWEEYRNERAEFEEQSVGSVSESAKTHWERVSEYRHVQENVERDIDRRLTCVKVDAEEKERNQERPMASLLDQLELLLQNLQMRAENERKENEALGIGKLLKKDREWRFGAEFCQKMPSRIRAGPLTASGRWARNSRDGLDHGGHNSWWIGIAGPLVSAGKAEARGSEWLPSDCSQFEPLSCMPTGINGRDPSDLSKLTRGFAGSSDLSTSHVEGWAEHSDWKSPLVTPGHILGFQS